MAKRGSNIYKRKDGRFEGRVPVGYRENGSIKYKSVYARTLAEVKQKMAELYAVGQEKPVSTLKLTVRDAAIAVVFHDTIGTMNKIEEFSSESFGVECR